MTQKNIRTCGNISMEPRAVGLVTEANWVGGSVPGFGRSKSASLTVEIPVSELSNIDLSKQIIIFQQVEDDDESTG